MSTNYQSELQRALWAVQKGIFPMKKLVTHKYKLEDINKAFEANVNRRRLYQGCDFAGDEIRGR